MGETLTSDNKLKAEVQGRDADNIIYGWKRIKHEPIANTIHILGLQGATSGTNTRTLASTATKKANIKGVGAINQQRTVDVIFSNPEKNKKDLYWDMYAAWQKGELVGLWRIDLNTVKGTKPNRTVEAQFSQSYVPNLPNTEALGGTVTSNLVFEVNGMEKAINSDENAFELDEKDLDTGILDDLASFYNFSHGTDIGTDGEGVYQDNTADDETIQVRSTTTGEDVPGPGASKPVVTPKAVDNSAGNISGKTDGETKIPTSQV